MRQLGKLWRERPDPRTPLVQVAVTLTRLVEQGNYTPQLFPDLIQDEGQEGRAGDEKLRRLDATLDQLRAAMGAMSSISEPPRRRGTAPQCGSASPTSRTWGWSGMTDHLIFSSWWPLPEPRHSATGQLLVVKNAGSGAFHPYRPGRKINPYPPLNSGGSSGHPTPRFAARATR